MNFNASKSFSIFLHMVIIQLLFWTSLTEAHTITESIKISASKEKVWPIIKNFKDLRWASPMLQVNSSSQNQTGDLREVLSPNGFSLIERLTQYDQKKMKYTYSLDHFSNPQLNLNEKIMEGNFTAELSLKKEKTNTEVEWRAQINSQWLNQRRDKDQIIQFVGQFYRESLINLKMQLQKLNSTRKK